MSLQTCFLTTSIVVYIPDIPCDQKWLTCAGWASFLSEEAGSERQEGMKEGLGEICIFCLHMLSFLQDGEFNTGWTSDRVESKERRQGRKTKTCKGFLLPHYPGAGEVPGGRCAGDVQFGITFCHHHCLGDVRVWQHKLCSPLLR